MPSDRTPAQWAVFCAEKVMGWELSVRQGGKPGDFAYREDTNGWLHLTNRPCGPGWDHEPYRRWSPYENPADALEMLMRLRVICRIRQLALPDMDILFTGDTWIVSIGVMHSASAIGPHLGPAACELALKVTGQSTG